MIKSKDEPPVGPAPYFAAVPGAYQQAGTPGSRTTAPALGRTTERRHPTPPFAGQSQSSHQGNTASPERGYHRPAQARPRVRQHSQAAGPESVVKLVNDAYHRAYTVPNAGFPRTESPYHFRTLEISEPVSKHVKFRKSGVAEIHVKGLPTLWFKTDHRINILEQPKCIRITRHGRALTATLVYQFPDYQPTRAPYQSCGIDPGVVQRLTVVNDRQQYQQIAGIDASQHRKTLRRLRRQMQRCRDAALRDGRARWVNVKRHGGTVKRRFRWNVKPSRKYLQVMAQLRRVEHKRIKTLQAEEHRITTEIVQNHELIAIEDTAIRNMTRSAKGTVESPG